MVVGTIALSIDRHAAEVVGSRRYRDEAIRARGGGRPRRLPSRRLVRVTSPRSWSPSIRTSLNSFCKERTCPLHVSREAVEESAFLQYFTQNDGAEEKQLEDPLARRDPGMAEELLGGQRGGGRLPTPMGRWA